MGIESQVSSYLLDLQNLEPMKSVEIVSICRIPYNSPFKNHSGQVSAVEVDPELRRFYWRKPVQKGLFGARHRSHQVLRLGHRYPFRNTYLSLVGLR